MLWRTTRLCDSFVVDHLPQKNHLIVSESVLVYEAFLPVWYLSTRVYTLPVPQSSSRYTYPRVKVCRRFKLKARHTRHHSPAAACKPRSENWRKPKMSLIMPSTGSTVHFRKR